MTVHDQASHVRIPSREPLRIICHVAAIDPRTNRLAATVTPSGWLLPIVAFKAGTPQAAMLEQGCAALSLRATPRCLAFPHIDRVTESIEHLLVADILDGRGVHATDGMIDTERLAASPPVVPYQQAALKLLAAARGSPGCVALEPFWLDQVTTWIAETLGLEQAEAGQPVRAGVYRASDRRAVASLVVGGRVLHFKTDSARPFVEAQVSQFVAAHCPAAVAPTVAFDSQRRWWLTEHVEGGPLTGDLWPAHLEAIATWITLQRTLQSRHGALQSAGVVCLDAETLSEAAWHALRTVRSIDPHAHDATELMARVRRLLARPMYRALPEGLLHFDAASRNIVQTPRGSVFLDFESVYLGPSILCGELMARRMKHQLTSARQVELSAFAVAAVLQASNIRTSPPPGQVSALTDLCLLAVHRARLMGDAHGAIDMHSPKYAWTRVSMDFLARCQTWRL